MKRIFSTILVCFIFLFLTACTSKDEKKFESDYEALNKAKNEDGSYKYSKIDIIKNNKMKYLTIEEVFDFFDKGTGFIYLGRPACPWCRIALPVLLDVADGVDVDYIYYYDIEEIRDENTSDYKRLVSLLYDYLPVDTVTQKEGDPGFDSSLKRIVLPDFYVVKNGTIISHHQGTVSSQASYNDELDNEQLEELMGIFREMLYSIE